MSPPLPSAVPGDSQQRPEQERHQAAGENSQDHFAPGQCSQHLHFAPATVAQLHMTPLPLQAAQHFSELHGLHEHAGLPQPATQSRARAMRGRTSFMGHLDGKGRRCRYGSHVLPYPGIRRLSI